MVTWVSGPSSVSLSSSSSFLPPRSGGGSRLKEVISECAPVESPTELNTAVPSSCLIGEVRGLWLGVLLGAEVGFASDGSASDRVETDLIWAVSEVRGVPSLLLTKEGSIEHLLEYWCPAAFFAGVWTCLSTAFSMLFACSCGRRFPPGVYLVEDLLLSGDLIFFFSFSCSIFFS